MKRILFVDDEENVLTGLKRMVRQMREEWQVSFASSGQQALEILANEVFDILVSDMRMQGMDGAELLSEVSTEYPQMIRILLSGKCDLESFIGSACPAHQLLGKPCDADALKRTIERTVALRGLLDNEALRSVVMQMNTLPSPPTLYLRIEKELGRKDSSMQRIGDIIGEDIGMTAKLLQLVNSSFFGFKRNIETPAQAASLLGVNMVQFIMLHVQTFAVTGPAVERLVEEISAHCVLVATLARAIAKQQGESAESCLTAYLGGMMHDLGRLIIAVNMPDKYVEIIEQAKCSNMPLWQAEQQLIGVTHAEIGAYLLGLWGLSEHVVEIVHCHHLPEKCELDNFFALAAVHVADVLVHDPELKETGHGVFLDESWLLRQDLLDRLPAWQVCAREIVEKNG
ncbi:MAG: response regulator [Mariprofundus sp.]|nr:response regulator [Mariprofundus sp.]